MEFPSFEVHDLGVEGNQNGDVDNRGASVKVVDHDGKEDLESLVEVDCVEDPEDLDDLEVLEAQEVLNALDVQDVRVDHDMEGHR